MAVVLPDVLPQLKNADHISEDLRSGILKVLTEASYGDTSIAPTAFDEIVIVCNRLAHALLLSMHLNAGTTVFVFPFVMCTELSRRSKGMQTEHSIPLSEVTRWMHEAEYDAPISASSRVELIGFIECVLIDLFALVSYKCACGGREVIHPHDILLAIAPNEKYPNYLYVLFAYLRGSPFSYEDAVALHFLPNAKERMRMDSRSWYHNAQVTSVIAREYVNGTRRSGDDTFFAHGVRPLQFFGSHHSLVRRLRYFPEEEEHNDMGMRVFSFELLDAAGQWMALVCELRDSVAHFRLATTGELVARIGIENNGTMQCLASDSMIIKRFKGSTDIPPLSLMESFVHTNHITSHAANLVNSDNTLISQAAVTLETKLILACELAQPHGPSFYTDNHPMSVRVRFTADMLDEAASRLPRLPVVLLRLIGEFAPTELPYIAFMDDLPVPPDIKKMCGGVPDEIKKFASQILDTGVPLRDTTRFDDDEDDEDEELPDLEVAPDV